MDTRSVYTFKDSLDFSEMAKSVQGPYPDQPLDKVEIQPNSKCNLRCNFCFGKHVRPATEVEIPYETLRNNVILPLAELPRRPFVPVAGLFGDPTLYSWFHELMVELLHRKFRVGLYTNGLRLEDSTIDAMVELSHSEAGKPCYVSFDIGALLQINRLNDVLPKIKRLCAERDPDRLQVNTPILLSQPVNLEELQERLLNAGSDAVRYIFPMEPVNHLEIGKTLYQLGELEKLAPGKVYTHTEFFDHCYVMLQTVSISPWGDVLPCSQTCSKVFTGSPENLSLGNILTESIVDVWNGPRRKELFETFDPRYSTCRCNEVDRRINEFSHQLRLRMQESNRLE